MKYITDIALGGCIPNMTSIKYETNILLDECTLNIVSNKI